MADNDTLLLEDAGDAAFTLDKAYRRALNDSDLDAMTQLKPQVDAAADAYSKARLNLLAAGVLATDDDVAAMRKIKGEVDQAANTQQLIAGAVQLIGLLGRFA